MALGWKMKMKVIKKKEDQQLFLRIDVTAEGIKIKLQAQILKLYVLQTTVAHTVLKSRSRLRTLKHLTAFLVEKKSDVVSYENLFTLR